MHRSGKQPKPSPPVGLARPESALFADADTREGRLVRDAEALARTLGVSFNASGATDPASSLTQADEAHPWSLCRRPWTLMYFTAHGRAIPCCIAPFSMRGYGWNLEMQMRAARAGLRIREVPVSHRRRAGGVSKVSGSPTGTLKAGWRILATLVRVAGGGGSAL